MLAAGIGAVGLWLLLPRPTSRGRALGVVLAAVSLGMIGAMMPRLGDWMAGSLFYILAGITVVAAVATVSLKNPVYSAIWFGLCLLGTAGLFIFQQAQFLAVATVVVYAGAILVTFLFVLMLAQPKGRATYDRTSWEAMISAFSGALIVGILSMRITAALAAVDVTGQKLADLKQGVLADAHVANIGASLFGRHLIAVEVAGVLLLAALVGAAVIVAQSRSQSITSGEPSTADGRKEVSGR